MNLFILISICYLAFSLISYTIILSALKRLIVKMPSDLKVFLDTLIDMLTKDKYFLYLYLYPMLILCIPVLVGYYLVVRPIDFAIKPIFKKKPKVKECEKEQPDIDVNIKGERIICKMTDKEMNASSYLYHQTLFNDILLMYCEFAKVDAESIKGFREHCEFIIENYKNRIPDAPLDNSEKPTVNE